MGLLSEQTSHPAGRLALSPDPRDCTSALWSLPRIGLQWHLPQLHLQNAAFLFMSLDSVKCAAPLVFLLGVDSRKWLLSKKESHTFA